MIEHADLLNGGSIEISVGRETLHSQLLLNCRLKNNEQLSHLSQQRTPLKPTLNIMYTIVS